MAANQGFTAVTDDAAARTRIGPWTEDGLADLSSFDPDTNFVVRAAAGSGKTTSLVARMVALVRSGVDVRSMAAITFTRKAAGEMNERFYRELKKARQALEDGPEDERVLVEQALRDVQHGFIGTIHAFCARLLREYPLAVSLPPGFATGIDEREERKLRNRALQRYLQSIHDEDPERLDELAQMGIDVDRLGGFFNRLCTYPDLDPYTDGPETVPDMETAVQEAVALLGRWQARRPDPPLKKRDKVMKAFDRAEAMRAHQDLETPAQRARFLKYFEGVVKGDRAKLTLSAWGKKGSEAYDRAYKLRDEELPHLARHTIRPLLRQWDAFVHRAVVGLLCPAVEQYRILRRDRGDLTHHDLLYFTQELLRDHPGVRARIQQRYRRLLVDEFQDTDPLQAEILFYLASTDAAVSNWRECTPRKGSLFIVGDDKQSIYRFRRADKEVFDEVAGLLSQSGGEVVDLTRNFRSLETICEWCNGAFEALFCEPELDDLQAEFMPFQPHRPPGNDDHGLRRIDIDKVHRNNADAIARKEAAKIARFIRAAHDGHRPDLIGDDGAVFEEDASYSDFLILTRTKKRLHVYAGEMARQNIPYVITGSEDLGESEELRSLIDLLTCALRPDDGVACAAYLRGGCCGMNDDDLYRFRRAGGRFDRMHEPQQAAAYAALSGELAERFRTAFQRIRQARNLLMSMRPGVAIEQIIGDAGLLAGAAHPGEAEEGSMRAGKVLRLLTYVRHLTAQGLDWAGIVEELRRLQDGEEKIDGMTLETGGGEAVRIMNLHQAKGLEAPVVFLADPYSSRGGSYDPEVHVRREEGEVVIPVAQGEDYYRKITHAPVGWHDDSEHAFQAEEGRHEAAQEYRLLYVAATRAKNLLVVSTYPEKPGKGYWSDLYAHLERADVPALQVPALEEVERRPAPDPDLGAARMRRSEKLTRVSRPGYEATSVTGDKKPAPAFGEGYGKDFGTAVHALFELLVTRRADRLALEGLPVGRVLDQHLEEATGEEVRRARAMAEGLLASDLWQEVLSAEEVHVEYPLTVVDEGDICSIRRGVIDLLYRTPTGWHLVDFKTDHIADEADLDPAANHPYVRQVRQYAAAWERIAGAPTSRSGIWFADVETFVPARKATS